jgi:peptidoglycan/LPS O-acetylase OafA/YrhL
MLLDARPLPMVGVVSYGMYLFHVAIITGVKILFPAIAGSAIAVFSIALPLTFVGALFSFRYFERPFLSPRPDIARAQQPASNEIAARA